MTPLSTPHELREAPPAVPEIKGSLRTMHVAFIAFCTALCALLCAWGLWNFLTGGGTSGLLTAVGTLIVGGGLIAYGRWFLHKLEAAGIR